MNFTPTDEQTAALALFTEGESMVIEAGAGVGKTTVLQLLAESTRRHGRYLAFNKAIVSDVTGRLPDTCVATTAHSLAFRAIGKPYAHRIDTPRMKSWLLAQMLDLHPIVIRYGSQTKRLAAEYLAGHVMRALALFCQTADEHPDRRHFPYIDGIDAPTDQGKRTYANNNLLAAELEPALERAWADIKNPQGQLPFGHSYLKLWQLSHPVTTSEYILFDEAQDASAVMAAVVAEQTHAQRVYVGDPCQCQPTGTLVHVVEHYRRGNRFTGIIPTRFRQVPIEEVREGDAVASFDVARSFMRRTGRRVVARASRPFDGQLVTVQTSADPTNISSRYTPDHRCVVRIGDALNGRWYVYLMKRGTNFRIGLVKGMYESQKGRVGLSMRVTAENADCAWVLSAHDTEADARLAEATTAWHYGLPSLRFKQGMARGMTQVELDQFWLKMGDLTDHAETCLRAHGRLIDHPFCTRENRLYRNRCQVIAAANLLSGMLVLPMSGAIDAAGKQVPKKRWRPVVVGREWYTGMVHSLDVEIDGTYVADGIVTHNSIYEWAGAIDAIERMKEQGLALATLTGSFRFGSEIADEANRWLMLLESDLRLSGLGKPSTIGFLDDIDEADAVLCRTNAGAVTQILEAQRRGVVAHLVGGGAQVLSFAKAANDLMRTGKTYHPELACFDSWNEVKDYVSNDPAGGELRLMVSLIEEFGVDTIRRTLERMPDEHAADLVVSTAHKAKGRQWNVVKLDDDFSEIEMSDPELRLQYVAITRASEHLDHSVLDETPSERPVALPSVSGTPDSVVRTTESVIDLAVEMARQVPRERESDWSMFLREADISRSRSTWTEAEASQVIEFLGQEPLKVPLD